MSHSLPRLSLLGVGVLWAAAAFPNSPGVPRFRILQQEQNLTWHEAMAAAGELATASGETWRMPNINELFSAYWEGENASPDPVFRQRISVWSSTTFPGHPSCALTFLLPEGKIGYACKTARLAAWVVPAGKPSASRLGPTIPPESLRSFWPPTGHGGDQGQVSFKGRSERVWRRPIPLDRQVAHLDSTSDSGPEQPRAATETCFVTGQSTSYAHGDDGWHQSGRRHIYHVLENGIVYDEASGLMWQREDDGRQRTYLRARFYCEALELGGFDDWRLPTLAEIQSIVDYERVVPTIDPIFAKTRPMNYWSSTSCADELDRIWVLYFGHGRTESVSTRSTCLVRAVRNAKEGKVAP